MSKLLVATVGHIAAGKTTVLTALSDRFNTAYISEGIIKRTLVSGYTYKDSLNEDIRDEGYRRAIGFLGERFSKQDIVLLDASFHRRYRREWVYRALEEFPGAELLWLNCRCSDEEMVRQRVGSRRQRNEQVSSEYRSANDQADDMSVYYHIMNSMDPLTCAELPANRMVGLMGIDSADNHLFEDHIPAGASDTMRTVADFIRCEYL